MSLIMITFREAFPIFPDYLCSYFTYSDPYVILLVDMVIDIIFYLFFNCLINVSVSDYSAMKGGPVLLVGLLYFREVLKS